MVAAACQDPGPDLVYALAEAGARVVAMDPSEEGLAALAEDFPDRIEPLIMPLDSTEILNLLGKSWGDEPVHLLVNLLPLITPSQPGRDTRRTLALFRSLARGLVKGRGSVVTMLRRTDEPFALKEHASLGATLAVQYALSDVFGPRNVRINSLAMQSDTDPEAAIAPAMFLGSRLSQGISGAVIDINTPPGS